MEMRKWSVPHAGDFSLLVYGLAEKKSSVRPGIAMSASACLTSLETWVTPVSTDKKKPPFCTRVCGGEWV